MGGYHGGEEQLEERVAARAATMNRKQKRPHFYHDT